MRLELSPIILVGADVETSNELLRPRAFQKTGNTDDCFVEAHGLVPSFVDCVGMIEIAQMF